ncbi:hypothetical protein FISHEDRAFT_73521 [Fistulina hepatica ATCC 64428]|uniref:Uncharacterized protein n=1 Tax=Fistulina hepatica ATCC 64428 TaxID=1128425 RepID=A0A0D7ACG3_9AGAR|nr:hypothetical protein FISHEDRAFT_73521 [Fistulina hepatica ATCC 64428]
MHEDVKPLQLSSAATSYKASSSGRRWRGRKRFNFTSRNKQRGDRSVSPCHSATKDTAVETQASDGFITIKTKREFIEQTLDESVAGPSRIPVDAVPKLSERAWSPNSIEIIRASSRSQVASRPIQFDFVKNQSPGVSEDPPLPRYSTRSRDGNGNSSTANDTLVIEGPERRGQKRKAPSSSHVSPVEQKFETPEVVLEASASQDARVSVSEPTANAPADLPSSLTASTVVGSSGELSRPESSACPPDPVYPSLEVRPVPNLHVPPPSRVSREADPSDSVPPFTLPQRPCLLAPSASSEILMTVTNDCEQTDVVSDVTMQPPPPEKMQSEHGGCEKPTADSAGLAQPSLHSPGSTPAGITPLSSISARVPVSAGSRASSSALSAQSIQERVDKAKMEIEEYRRKRRRLLSDAEALEDELAAEQEHIALLEELKRERKALRNDEQLVRAKQRQLEELRQQREVLEMDTD